MRNRIHVVVAAVLFIAGIVCFAESQVLAGNVLVVAAGLAYAADLAVRVSHHRTAVALSSDDDRTSQYLAVLRRVPGSSGCRPIILA